MSGFSMVPSLSKRSRRASLLLVALPLLLYVALSPIVAWPLYNAMLFRPDKRIHNVDKYLKLIEYSSKVTKRDVTFPSANGKMLHAWFFELPNTKRVFLVSHGKGGNIFKKTNIARVLLQCGGSVFLYDYQGHGRSEGDPSLDGVCEDAVAAYDYLTQKEHRTGKDIIAYGESFGTGVSGQLTRQRQVGAVILNSGYTSILRAGRDALPWLRLYPDAVFPKQTLDNIAAFKGEHPPLLIVHSTEDRCLSYRNSAELFKEASDPKQMLTLDRDQHGSFGTGAEFFPTVAAFLERYKL